MANGPLSILQTAVRSHAQVLISIRSNRKLYVLSLPSISEKRWNESTPTDMLLIRRLARVKAFDRHCNMILENVVRFPPGVWWLEGY